MYHVDTDIMARRSSRPHHVLRAVLAALLFCAVLALPVLPAVASPASEAAELEKQLADIRADFKKAGAAYDRAYWQLDETESRIATIDANIAATEAELGEARVVLQARLSQMYRSDTVDYLTVLLGADSFQEMVTRLEFVQRIGAADAQAIQVVEDLQAKLRVDRETLEAERAERESAVSSLKSERDTLQERMRSKQAEYDKAKSRLDALRRQSSPSATPAAPGANGMVFPVRGPFYYSDTWGASRSGGRRSHKGTDIMAPRGTPCVATLSGTVTSKNNSLGGKTIWLTADNGWKFYYAHLDSWAVTSGRVAAGQTIGYVGYTGNASASSPHLHFEIHPSGSGAVNPYPYLRKME